MDLKNKGEIWPFYSAVEMSMDIVSSYRKTKNNNKETQKGEQVPSIVHKLSPVKELKPYQNQVVCD